MSFIGVLSSFHTPDSWGWVPLFSRSLWLPDSATVPFWITTTSAADCTVDRRWAIVMTVLPRATLSRASCTRASLSASNADVACRRTKLSRLPVSASPLVQISLRAFRLRFGTTVLVRSLVCVMTGLLWLGALWVWVIESGASKASHLVQE